MTGDASPVDLEKAVGKAVLDGVLKTSNFNKTLFKQELPVRWVVIPVVLFFVVCALLLAALFPPRAQIFLFIVGLLPIVWLSSSIHIKFDSKTVTGIAGLVAFIGLILAAGLMNPPELVGKVDRYFNKPSDANSKSN